MTSSLGLNWDNDLSSEDPAVVARGETLLEAVIDCNAALGSKYLVGVIYSALGKYSRARRRRADARTASPRCSAWRAAPPTSGITLGLEVVNRYETNLFNTAAQALDIVREIGEPNLGVHLDTYHMNIEEDDFDEPVRLCGDKLVYVHIGESHRGYLGSGNVDFATFFRALGECGYAGPIAFESFSSAVVAPALSNTLGVWRNLWTDNRDLARHAKEFIDRLRRRRKIISISISLAFSHLSSPVGAGAATFGRRTPRFPIHGKPQIRPRPPGSRSSTPRHQIRGAFSGAVESSLLWQRQRTIPDPVRFGGFFAEPD